MSNNTIRTLREQLGYTQSDLAEQTNLSIRTIQRVESGQTVPKGHTLNVLVEALGVDKMELQKPIKLESRDSEEDTKLKLLNLSALCFIGIPFGNILVPFIIWEKYKKYSKVNQIGREILNFQITWTLGTVLMLIISPFLQDFIPWNFSLMLVLSLLAVFINIYFIIHTAQSLNRRNYDLLPLKIQFL